MQNKLQELTDKLYNEGLSKGKQEAELLRANAKKEAEKIIADAKNEAAQMAYYSSQMLLPTMMDDAEVKDNRARFY